MNRDKITISIPLFNEMADSLIISHEHKNRQRTWIAEFNRGNVGGCAGYYEFDLDLVFLKSIIAFIEGENKKEQEIK